MLDYVSLVRISGALLADLAPWWSRRRRGWLTVAPAIEVCMNFEAIWTAPILLPQTVWICLDITHHKSYRTVYLHTPEGHQAERWGDNHLRRAEGKVNVTDVQRFGGES